ncbi:hypothetical protein B0H13DRAFT_1887299 [Mycena leptocephala]|nr:hypothetical protein B0H13DRAFT_1887299 [Mycena leptocephala]
MSVVSIQAVVDLRKTAAAAARHLPTSVKCQQTWWLGARGKAVLLCHSRRLAVTSLGETPSGPGGFSETRQLTLGDCVTYVTFHSFSLTSMLKRKAEKTDFACISAVGTLIYDADHNAAHGTRSQYIDNSTEVDHDPLMREDASDDDDDSYEAQLRRQDQEDFDMDAIDAGHEDRLRSDARYTIPTPLLQSGAETPSRGDDFYTDIPSRAPSPVPAWTAPAQSGSCASTPIYISPQDDALGAQTPLFLPEREQTPLFLPGSRGPTPYDFDFRGETPTFFLTLVGPIPRRPEAPLFKGLRLPSPHRDFTPIPSFTSPAPSRPTSPEPPAKKRRVESGADAEDSPHRRRLHRFLDVSAEDSDEEEEDEETLSDKAPRPVFPEEDETEDDLRALAAAYEDAGREYSHAAQEEHSVAPVRPVPASTASAPPVVAEDPFVPDTWVIPRRGLYKGLLALVLTKRKFLAAPVSTSTPVGMGLMGHQEFNKCIEVSLATDMLRQNFTPVHPTADQLAAFLADDHLALEKLRFRGLCPALAEGDRVVVVHGPHQGATGFIVVLREVPVSGQRVKYAKILKAYNSVDILKKEDAGLYVQVAHLEHHGLDIPCAIVVQDRVRVVSGILYRGITGRVIDNSQGFLTVAASSNSEIIGATTTSEISDRQVFQISIRYVNRDFRCGDLVRVRSGKHKGRVGLIVATFTGGSIEIFDGDKPKLEETEIPDVVFKVRAANVDFATFDERESGLTIEHAGISSYTPTSHVAGLKPLIRDEATEKKAAAKPKAERTEKEKVDCAVLVATIMRLNRLTMGIPSDAGGVDKVVDTKIMKTGRRYEGIPVLVAGQGSHKGFQGTIIGDHDNAARVRRLAKKHRKGEDSWHDEDQDGIVITIRGKMNLSTVDVTVDKCLHRYTSLPLTKARFLPRDVLMGHVTPRQKGYLQGGFPAPKTPPCVGEDNGEWMCVPGLNGKHFDVQVVGITGVKERVSSMLQKLEGRFGHILATAAIDLGAKKVEVCGVGKSGTKHAVHVQCIKPRRKNNSGRLITEVAERVVVIGPDMAGGTTLMGCYGLTQPDIPHYYEASVVCVLVECLDGTFDPNFFKGSSLCLAKNVALTYQNQLFTATTFPP